MTFIIYLLHNIESFSKILQILLKKTAIKIIKHN